MVEFSLGLSIAIGLLLFVVHCIFALAVYEDAVSLNFGPKGTLLVSPGAWAFATVLLGPFFAAVYWLMHHSTLNGSIQRPRP